MRAILIDPFACRVMAVRLPDDVMEMLSTVYGLLSHETFQVDSLDGVPLGTRDYLIVSGHGLLQDPPVQRWFRLHGMHHETLAGKGLIVGRTDEGTETDTNFAVRDVDYRAIYFACAGTMLVETLIPWSPDDARS